jgi:hypothetical protein
VRHVTSSTQPHVEEEWHVRRQRPDARATLISFIDADANRISFAHFLDRLEGSESFRSLFIDVLAECDAKLFVWQMPSITSATLGGEFECAVIEAPPPAKKKFKVDPEAFAPHLRPDESVVVCPSPDGAATLVVPCPKQAEGWYAELATFLRRVRPAQSHALWQTLARTAKASVATKKIWLSSSAPGAPWLHMRLDTTPANVAYRPYAR